VENFLVLPAHGNAGEGEYGQAGNWLAKASSGFKAAPQEHILHLCAGSLVRGTRDDVVVVDLALSVDIGLDHDRVRNITDGIAAYLAG
jgi:hypothetical protein